MTAWSSPYAKELYEHHYKSSGPNAPVPHFPSPKYSTSLLTFVVNANRVQEAERLLMEGAEPNARDCLGRTPVWYCTSIPMLQLLRKYGADLNLPDVDNCSPLAQATTCGLSYEYQMALSSLGAVHTDESRRTLDEDRGGKRLRTR
jgi:hypothetical protein